MATLNRVDSYLVCATPRTGSSLLMGLLDSTGVAGHPQAYFREPDEPLWAERWQVGYGADGEFDYAAYVRAALAAGRSDNGVFGAKLMPDALEHLVTKLGTLHPDLAGDALALLRKVFGTTAFVLVRRDDALSQAVSWWRAEQTGTWFVGGHGEIDRGRPAPVEPFFDADRITGYLREIAEHEAGWERWFAAHGIRPRRVVYEDLVADMPTVVRELLRALGIDPSTARAVGPRHHRQADRLNDEWVKRYRDLHPGP